MEWALPENYGKIIMIFDLKVKKLIDAHETLSSASTNGVISGNLGGSRQDSPYSRVGPGNI